MTENEIRQKVVTGAKKYLGCKESDGTHRQFIERYNAFQPLPRNHKMTYTAAWCATFVSVVAIECGLTDIIPVECGCGYMISLYKKLGRWQENDNYVPKPGDIIFYDWNDGADYAETDDKGAPEHIGIVTAAADGVISVIEGNKNDAVGLRTVTVNGRYIRGYGLPNYASKSTAPIPKPVIKCPYSEPKAELRYGSKGKPVKWAQWYLNKCGASLKIDGSFGPLTKAATIKFQKNNNLVTDGIVGVKTRAKLKAKAKV